MAINLDNAVACYPFVKASHRNLETAMPTTMVTLDMKALTLSIAPFLTHVLSELNIADWATRVDLLQHFAELGGALFRVPVTVEKWVDTRASLKRLRVAGIDLASAKGPEPLLKRQKPSSGPVVAPRVDHHKDPLAWALTLPELKEGGFAPKLAKVSVCENGDVGPARTLCIPTRAAR